MRSKTNFLATPESKAAYPWGASLSGMTVAFTILAMGRRSCRIACINCRRLMDWVDTELSSGNYNTSCGYDFGTAIRT
jgi:hypothetical protein